MKFVSTFFLIHIVTDPKREKLCKTFIRKKNIRYKKIAG